MIDYGDVINRIQEVNKSCSKSEQTMLMKILQEIAATGDSETLERLWLQDFKEVPVSIEQFLCDPHYLGSTNNNGAQVYPFWHKTMKDIFDHGNKYFEIALSGATRVGKSSTSVSIMAYMLYRLMIYRNWQEYFKKKQVSKATLAFANLTKDLANGVAFHEFQSTLKESPWFNEHGSFTNSHTNPLYIPEGEDIDIIPASDSAHVLGMQLWCLVGNTEVLLSDGSIYHIKDLVDEEHTFVQYSALGELVESTAYVRKTKEVEYTIAISFNNNEYCVEGTPDHQIMLADGTYKELQHIRFDDKIKCIQLDDPYNDKVLTPTKIDTIEYVNPIPVYDVVNAAPYHNFIICFDGDYIISHNCCLMDEVNFTRAGIKDINISKKHMKELYNTANARITGTFRLGGEVYGKLLSSSSKNSDTDYLSEHIQTQLDAGNQHMYLVDEPQWNILPPEMFSGKYFYITVGDRYKRGFVVPKESEDEMHLEDYKRQGYQILRVPEDFRTNFNADYDISLRDIAGISVVGAMGFITQESVTPCVSPDRVNPFFVDILWIGKNDNDSLENNFHAEVVRNNLRNLPMYVHVDFAETSDHIGICGVVQDGTKVVFNNEANKNIALPFFREIFQIAIGAPRGDRMSFQKVIDFVLWLRQQRFNVAQVSTDQYQSSYVRETLEQQGFNTTKISVDKSEDPYIALRNLIQDQRIDLIKHQLQEDELVHLQRINGRIDHPPQGTNSMVPDATNGWSSKGIGKDCADALCGAAYACLTSAESPRPSGHAISGAMAMVNSTSNRFNSNTSKLPGVFNSPYRKITR